MGGALGSRGGPRSDAVNGCVVYQEERRVLLEQLAVEYFGWGWADEPSLEERVEATARDVEEWKRRRTASLTNTSTEGGAAEGAP